MTVQIEPGNAALLILDMQNDVIGREGKFAESGAPAHAESQNVVENVGRLAAAARQAGMAVIHIHYIVEPGHAELRQNAKLYRDVKGADSLVRGTWGAAPVPGLEPEGRDLVVEKRRMNGFHDSGLETALRGLGADTIVVSGCWTNFSVEHTCRHGADAGYRVVIVSDGTSTIGDEWQEAALNYALTNIAEQATVDEVIAGLGAVGP